MQEFTYEVWLGEKYAGDYGKDKDNTDSVFITRTGTVYHKTRNCPALYIDVKMVDFSQIIIEIKMVQFIIRVVNVKNIIIKMNQVMNMYM